MTSSIQAYNFILAAIEKADSYFAFKCIDHCLEHWSRCFPEHRAQKSELIDARCDKWQAVFNPKFQIKTKTDD